MRDMSNKVGDIDQIRAERDARNNPPSYEVGQGSDDDWGDIFDNSSTTDSSSFGGSSYGDSGGFGTSSFGDANGFGGLGDSSFGGSFGGSMQPGGMQQPNQVNTDMEDKVIKGIATVSKHSFSFTKDILIGLREGLSKSDCFDMSAYSGKVLVSSGTVTVVSFILWCFSIFSSRLTAFKWVSIGGMISLSLGFLLFGFSLKASREAREKFDKEGYPEDTESEGFPEEFNDGFDSFEGNEDSSSEDEEDDFGWGSFDSDSDESDDEDSGFDDNIWDFGDSSVEEEEEVVQEVVDIEDAISSIREIQPHTQTRQYLFEEYSKVLPKMNPSFATFRSIPEDDPNFLSFDQILREASIQVGAKEDKIPVLIDLRENSFIIQLKATRPTGLKEEEIASEIANIYSRDDYGYVEYEGVYATTSSVGGSFIINIFKGENNIISLADAYTQVKDYVLDVKNKMPIVFGINELGKVWTFDGDKLFSYIISGKPRSGKSWSVVSLILQMCMYNSPKEVTFEAFDVKGSGSDYKTMSENLPHFKNFESDSKRILNRLRYITTKEADRRKKLLEKASEMSGKSIINIASMKDEGVDIYMPYLYVVIDEIVGLIGNFTKEEHAEFKDLVNVLITQMPNLGIKLILVPHRVTNDIVPKTTYTNVSLIACVRSDVKEINNTLDISRKDFPYSLVNKGDTALKSGEVNKGKTVFSHGVAITKTDDGNVGVYRFVGSLWRKLEPEEEENKNTTEVKKEAYKGHTLVGIDSVDEVDDDEDFWDIL